MLLARARHGNRLGFASSPSVGQVADLALFIGPTLLILGALVVYPLLYGFYISGFNTNLLQRWNWIGLQNYVTIFTRDSFPHAIKVSLIFSAAVVAGHFLLGILFALVLNQPRRGNAVLRSVLLLPWLIPEVVVGLTWRWMLNPLYGPVNDFLSKIGLASNIDWLGVPGTALLSVIVAAIWKGYPLIMVMVLAGLQSIPSELYEAAKIDGAGGWQSFRYVTLPSLRHVLFVALVLDTVWWFKHYTIIWTMTQGGPVSATDVVSVEIYQTAFSGFRFGEAGAMSVVVFTICLALSFVYRRLLAHAD